MCVCVYVLYKLEVYVLSLFFFFFFSFLHKLVAGRVIFCISCPMYQLLESSMLILVVSWFMLCAAPWPPTVAYCQMAFTLLCEEGANLWSLEEMELLSI